MKTAIVATRRTADDRTVLVWSDGAVTSGDSRPWTMHRRALDVSTALLVADESALFDAAEMPSLIAAAHRLLPRTPRGVLPGALRALASRLSQKAGTRPADVAVPLVAVDLAVWTEDELRHRAAGNIVCPRSTRRAMVPMA